MHIDAIEGYPLPVLLVRGWLDAEPDPEITLEMQDGAIVTPDFSFRVPRPDVRAAGASNLDFPGFVAEFHLVALPRMIRIGGQNYPVDHSELYGSVVPHYADLLNTKRILRRSDIYGSGPPLDANPDIVTIAKGMSGPLLDFGCGNGDLLAKVRQSGTEAFGIEIDREAIRATLKSTVAPFVTLYSGDLPLPYANGQFVSTLSSEVLEHIDGVEPYAAEIARVTQHSLFVTVPDMSSVPLSYQTGTVPWHLLESTHVNFFNSRSMVALFKDWFEPLKFFRFNNNSVHSKFIPGSLGVMFRRLNSK
jgi:SAM-dependent methyltransferase